MEMKPCGGSMARTVREWEMKPCGEYGSLDVAHTRTSPQSGESAGESLNRDVSHAGLHVDPAVR